MTNQEKAAASFRYQCNRASDCRHEKYQVSCFGCPQFKTCDIQQRIEQARAKM